MIYLKSKFDEEFNEELEKSLKVK